MIPIAKILFPVDFSERCRGAAHAVRTVARRFNAGVTTLHVIELASPSGDPDILAGRAQHAMETLIACEFAGCKVARCVTTGDPATAIVEHAHNGRFDLIMMPTHGYGPFRRFLLGSVSAKVLHDSLCPVWTSAHLEEWPEVENIPLRRVLCAVDLGPRSCTVLKCASLVAAEFGAKLTVAHVIPALDVFAGEYWSPQWRDQAVKAAEERVATVQQGLGLSAEIDILDGASAAALSESAERMDADLMVIGRTHVMSGVGKLGANAYAIIAHSPCPVLSV